MIEESTSQHTSFNPAEHKPSSVESRCAPNLCKGVLQNAKIHCFESTEDMTEYEACITVRVVLLLLLYSFTVLFYSMHL